VKLNILVQPGANRNRIAGYHGERVKIGVSAPPEKGKANKAVCELLAREFGVRKSDVRVVSGVRCREKTVEVLGIDESVVREKLTAWRAKRSRA